MNGIKQGAWPGPPVDDAEDVVEEEELPEEGEATIAKGIEGYSSCEEA